MEQQLLFPELDPYKTKIKDIDYVDVSKIKCGELKKIPYSILPEGKYMLFKSGGFNKYHSEMGNAFPYIQNTETLKVLSITATEYNGYVKASILLPNKQGLFIQMHRIVAEAFIHNDMPDKKVLVDHINGDTLNYTVDNLRWVTPSQNMVGVKRKRQITFFDKARMENLKNKK